MHFLKWRRSESGAKSSSNICRSSSIISHSGAPLQEDTWENSKTSSWTVPTQRASHMMYTHIHVTTTQAFTHMYTESRPEQCGRFEHDAMMNLVFSRRWQELWSPSIVYQCTGPKLELSFSFKQEPAEKQPPKRLAIWCTLYHTHSIHYSERHTVTSCDQCFIGSTETIYLKAY